MLTKPQILDAALGVLREGQTLTIDAVARAAGLTKPGVVHHFPTKEALALAVVDRLVDTWEIELRRRAGADGSAVERLRAYVDFALTAELDPSDLAPLSDVRLRERLSERWVAKLDPWFGEAAAADAEGLAALRAARLLADGAWFNRALGTVDLTATELDGILAVALRLVEEGASG